MMRMIVRSAVVVAALATVSALAFTTRPAAQAPCPCMTEYWAQGVVVNAKILDKVSAWVVNSWVRQPGQQEKSLADINIPIGDNSLGLTGGITGKVAYASAKAGRGKSDATAEVANLNVLLGGPVNLMIDVVLLRSVAHAECTFPESNTSGHSEVLGLTVDLDGAGPGSPEHITVTSDPNQVVTLPGGAKLIINEQKPVPDTDPETGVTRPMIVVSALHLIVPGIADVTVSSANAMVTCYCAPTN